MNYCPKCNKYVNDNNQQFCTDCGEPLKRLTYEKMITNDTAVSLSKEKPEKKQFGLGVIAGLVVALAIGGAFFFLSNETPKSGDESLRKRLDVSTTKSISQPTVIDKPKSVKKPNLDLAKEGQSSVMVTQTHQNATTDNNAVNARNAFISFHQSITNRQLQTAFDILSPDYQRFMRSYDNFVRGYDTTLRSDVVELNTIQEDNNSATFAYKLKAVDREGTGQKIQYFVGKAKLVKINGQWRIDSTEAKRVNEKTRNEITNTAPVNNTTARDTFLKFHQFITKHQLRSAYAILSPDYQRYVGSYEKFSPGYDTTISSEVVEIQRLSENANSAVFSYKLKAVDHEGSGTKTQYFRGKVELIKINGTWRIDSTEAKRL